METRKKFRKLWASPHTPTNDQKNYLDGALYLKDIDPDLLRKLTNIGLDTDLESLADKLLDLCAEHNIDVLVQPAGSPKFMTVLGVQNYKRNAIEIVFAVSERISKDIPQADGTVKKISQFKHLGWK